VRLDAPDDPRISALANQVRMRAERRANERELEAGSYDTCDGVADACANTMRMPISRVRCVTEFATKP